MQRGFKLFEHVINAFMVAALSLMVILVFGNVVLRYLFSTGINASEEVSRFLFVWLTFLGSIIAFRDNEHLGVDTLVKHLPTRLKKFVLFISNVLMLFLCALIGQGSWKLTVLNLHTKAPATGLPLSVMYLTGILLSVSIGIIIIVNLYRLLLNKIKPEDLIMIKESEELIESHKQDTGKDGDQA